MVLRSFVHAVLIACLAIVVYNYLGDFFVYLGEPVYLTTTYGQLKGRILKARGGREIYSFTSIPYAKPPLDDLRFEPPVLLGKWDDDILDATIPPKLCLQVDQLWKTVVGTEDCLHLHVHTPNIDASKGLRPVIVWFHGGHFMFGGNNLYGPEYLLQNGDVVLVTVNYRLNSFGFLSTGDNVVPGNMGLKDQALALKWIQRVIRDFGGDPEQVTLFGCSAGGASVNYHMLSPMSKGLFHRAISQSGSSLCPWAFTRNPKRQAARLGEMLNCTGDSAKTSLQLVNCLKTKQATEIVNVHHEINDIFHEIDAIFGPTIEAGGQKDSVFLPDSPSKLYQTGKFHHVPWIAGVTSEEGCFRSSLIMTYEDKLSALNDNWAQVAPKTFLLYDADPSAALKVKKFYFRERIGKDEASSPGLEGNRKGTQGLQQIGWNDLESLTNAYSDRFFFGCVHDAAVLHAKHAPVHLYYYTYKPDIGYGYVQETARGILPVRLELILGYLKFHLYRDVLKWPINDYGVCHTDEMQNLFQLDPLLSIDENSPHYEFSTRMVQLWTSFAKNGKPGEFGGIKWTPLQQDKKTNSTAVPLQYLRLGKVPAMIDEPFSKRLQFWEELKLPKN